ncbi:MAG: hypothetical protein ABR915_25840 [Thermoguttaceae bacterium]|jgi:hypothetical protein
MKSLFTIHVGEYLVGLHIEKAYKKAGWNIWLPAKDTGIDLLVSDSRNRKTVSLQVKFAKDSTPQYGTPIQKNRLLAMGWWTLDPKKIAESIADFWVFVLPSFVEKKDSFIILPPAKLLRRLKAIPGLYNENRIQSYFHVTKKKRCWQTRGLSRADEDALAQGEEAERSRDFSECLINAWKPIEDKLK